jgi:hypothetical protein
MANAEIVLEMHWVPAIKEKRKVTDKKGLAWN